MLKAVLDTSILVSAFLKHDGVNAAVLRHGKDRYHFYLSEEILEETTRVLLTYERMSGSGKNIVTAMRKSWSIYNP